MVEPLRFTPLLKRIRWGGRRLGTVLGKSIGDGSDFAESWEVSDHSLDQTVVAQGEFVGWTLQRLVRERSRELLGRHANRTQFPLLIKFLDANDRLSLQVHPNDVQARRYRADDNGKTEAWVILEAAPGSRVFAGLRHGVTRDSLQHALETCDIESCLHSFAAAAGQCVFVPAGTVHAIDAGILLAEVQQSSDTTFRLHDWGRLGTEGRPRPVHITEALDCTDFTRGPVSPVVPRLASLASHVAEDLVECPQFVIRRHATNAMFPLMCDDRFRIVMLLSGQSELESNSGVELLTMGDTILVPAACQVVRIAPRGDVRLLEIYLS
ncbi:MAG: class I mannose-6-phosphate isomerase [Planctomycetales bacterium]|nr:class I mannose-6-phosphate isomerase [Planctomycetales bacterium]